MRRQQQGNGRVLAFLFVASGLTLLAAIALLTIFVLGGDDDDDAPVEPDPTRPADQFGSAPTLDGNVTTIYPEHGATVTREETRSGNGAVCIEVEFNDTNGQWYRMAVDGEEVTDATIWRVNSQTAPEFGSLCYDPAEGLRAGVIDAAVTVQEPNGMSPAREIVEWRFEVTN